MDLLIAFGESIEERLACHVLLDWIVLFLLFMCLVGFNHFQILLLDSLLLHLNQHFLLIDNLLQFLIPRRLDRSSLQLRQYYLFGLQFGQLDRPLLISLHLTHTVFETKRFDIRISFAKNGLGIDAVLLVLNGLTLSQPNLHPLSFTNQSL